MTSEIEEIFQRAFRNNGMNAFVCQKVLAHITALTERAEAAERERDAAREDVEVLQDSLAHDDRFLAGVDEMLAESGFKDPGTATPSLPTETKVLEDLDWISRNNPGADPLKDRRIACTYAQSYRKLASLTTDRPKKEPEHWAKKPPPSQPP